MSAKQFKIQTGKNMVIESPMAVDNASSIQDDLNQRYLSYNINSIIGKPRSFEKTDYYFNGDQLNFNLYFFKDLTDTNKDYVKKFVGSAWNTYYDALNTKIEAGLKDNKSNIYMPSFYNSFGYLYNDVNNDYGNMFNNQAFFYYSFIKIDFYTSPDITKRKKVFTKLIYNNNRYLGQELGYNDQIQPSPNYILNQETDGFVLNWLIDTPITELYATFTYFNAFKKNAKDTKGETIYLLPSAANRDTNLKWVVKEAAANSYYVKYVLNPNSKTYTINLYDVTKNDFSIVTNEIDFYSVVVDPYWGTIDGYVNFSKKIAATPTINKKDSIVLKETFTNIYLEHVPDESEYTTDRSFVNGGTAKNIMFSKKQEIKNDGDSTLRLKQIAIELELRDTKISSISDNPFRMFYNEVSLDNPLTNPRKYTSSAYLFYQTRYTDRLLSSTGTSYNTRQSSYPLYKDTDYLKYCRPLTIDKITLPIVKKEMPIVVDVIYQKDFSSTLTPKASADIDINVKISGTFVRGCMKNMFLNFLIYEKLNVIVFMEDVNSGDVIEKSFVIDLRLLVQRSKSKDVSTVEVSYGTYQIYDPYNNTYNTVYDDAGNPETREIVTTVYNYFDGVGYTQNDLNKDKLNIIGK